MEFLETFYAEVIPIFLFTVMMAMDLPLTLDDLKEVVWHVRNGSTAEVHHPISSTSASEV